MTKADVLAFVESDIAARYKGGLNSTQQGDWIRAVWKAGSIEQARRIVQEIVDDPETTLALKVFYRRLAAATRTERRSRSLPAILNPYVLCLEAPPEHPDWQGQEWLRLDKFRNADCTNRQYAAQYAHDIAKAIEQVYGGVWTGVVRPDGSPPENWPVLHGEEARAWVEKHRLNGPTGPGRDKDTADPLSRAAASLKRIPPEPPRKTVATRADIERLKTPKPLPECPHAKLSDDEFFDQASKECAAAETPRWAKPVESDDPADQWQHGD